ncbi:MAG: helix-turn-helix domain-containing protein [Microbacteriaceae bacterium]
MPEPTPPFVNRPDFEELRFYLARLRKTNGWTLEELEQRSGVARRSISQLEAGKAKGNVETWFKLSEAFNLEIGQVLSVLYGPTKLRTLNPNGPTY